MVRVKVATHEVPDGDYYGAAVFPNNPRDQKHCRHLDGKVIPVVTTVVKDAPSVETRGTQKKEADRSIVKGSSSPRTSPVQSLHATNEQIACGCATHPPRAQNSVYIVSL